jgi:predicted nucleic acid-binding Zn ribbon protein
VKDLGDRIQQLEADLENVYTQLERLSEALSAEQTRGRAARMGRYLLWGALIAAMATFWMMLRLRAGSL